MKAARSSLGSADPCSVWLRSQLQVCLLGLRPPRIISSLFHRDRRTDPVQSAPAVGLSGIRRLNDIGSN